MMPQVGNKYIAVVLALTLALSPSGVFAQQTSPVGDVVSTENGNQLALTPAGRVLDRGAIPDLKDLLNPYSISIPEAHGAIEEVFQGSPNSPLVVHIQDAHANYEAQSNIKAILHHLQQNYGVSLVQLEGAASKLNPATFEAAYLKEANAKLADYLMRQGRLSGAEAFAIESEEPVELYGVEDKVLYIENLRTFRAVYSHQADLDNFFKEMRMLAKDLRTKLLNAELLDLTRKMEAYAQERIELLDYLLYLNKLAEKYEIASLKDLSELVRFPNLVRILRLHDMEQTMDQRLLEQEVKELKQLFRQNKLGEEESLMVDKMGMKKTGVKPRIYFKKLNNMALNYDVDLLNYTQMRRFGEFLILQDEIEHHGLFSEVSRLERLLQKNLLKTKVEQLLIDLLKAIELLNQYFSLEVNREKLTFVIKRFEKIRASIIKERLDALAAKLEVMPSGYSGDTAVLDELMNKVEYFYRIVLERDKHFVENVMTRMQSAGEKKTVLITGGFHTDGMTRLLREKDISYVVMIPRVNVKEGSGTYVKVMLEEDTAVGTVFAGTFALAEARNTQPVGEHPNPTVLTRLFEETGLLASGLNFQQLVERTGTITTTDVNNQLGALRASINDPANQNVLRVDLPAVVPGFNPVDGTVEMSVTTTVSSGATVYEGNITADSFNFVPVDFRAPAREHRGLTNLAEIQTEDVDSYSVSSTVPRLSVDTLTSTATFDAQQQALDPGEYVSASFPIPGQVVPPNVSLRNVPEGQAVADFLGKVERTGPLGVHQFESEFVGASLGQAADVSVNSLSDLLGSLTQTAAYQPDSDALSASIDKEQRDLLAEFRQQLNALNTFTEPRLAVVVKPVMANMLAAKLEILKSTIEAALSNAHLVQSIYWVGAEEEYQSILSILDPIVRNRIIIHRFDSDADMLRAYKRSGNQTFNDYRDAFKALAPLGVNLPRITQAGAIFNYTTVIVPQAWEDEVMPTLSPVANKLMALSDMVTKYYAGDNELLAAASDVETKVAHILAYYRNEEGVRAVELLQNADGAVVSSNGNVFSFREGINAFLRGLYQALQIARKIQISA